jgi:hypothetical protein
MIVFLPLAFDLDAIGNQDAEQKVCIPVPTLTREKYAELL